MADGFLKNLNEAIGGSLPPGHAALHTGAVGPVIDSALLQQWTTSVGAAVEGLGGADGAEHAAASADITVEAASDGAAVDGDVVDAYGEPDTIDGDASPVDGSAEDPSAAAAGE
jgi:hypothetical protein